MRLIGLILVVIGALALGYERFTYATRDEVEANGPEVREQVHTIWVPPVVGGIAVVSGLLLVASDGRRGEN